MVQKKLDVDLVFVTGMSGAGRSTALKILEDMGYAIIDNLPSFLLSEFLEGIKSQKVRLPLVVGFELKSFAGEVEKIMKMMKSLAGQITLKLFFLDCQDNILIKRYNVSRHRHPLGAKTLLEGIKQERALLAPALSYADHVIDTSFATYITLGRILNKIFTHNSSHLEVTLVSFSYRGGLPPEADIIFDARFLENPFYEENLRLLSGKDNPVATFLRKDPSWEPVYKSIQHMLVPTLLGFKKSGRSYLILAVGCTGGQHRSVFMVEQLANFLESLGERVLKEHRELKD